MVPSVSVSMVIAESPVLYFAFGEQCEENGTKYIDSSSDTENSLPFCNSVARCQTLSDDRPSHPWNGGEGVGDAQEDAGVRGCNVQMVDAESRRAKAPQRC